MGVDAGDRERRQVDEALDSTAWPCLARWAPALLWKGLDLSAKGLPFLLEDAHLCLKFLALRIKGATKLEYLLLPNLDLFERMAARAAARIGTCDFWIICSALRRSGCIPAGRRAGVRGSAPL